MELCGFHLFWAKNFYIFTYTVFRTYLYFEVSDNVFFMSLYYSRKNFKKHVQKINPIYVYIFLFYSRIIEQIDQSEFEGFEYVNPLLMSLEDCVWHNVNCALHPNNLPPPPIHRYPPPVIPPPPPPDINYDEREYLQIDIPPAPKSMLQNIFCLPLNW